MCYQQALVEARAVPAGEGPPLITVPSPAGSELLGHVADSSVGRLGCCLAAWPLESATCKSIDDAVNRERAVRAGFVAAEHPLT